MAEPRRDDSRTREAAALAQAILASPRAADLSERDREALRLRATGLTLDEISATLGITKERVRQIQARACRRTGVFPGELPP